MLPQLAAAPILDPDQQVRGLWRIATGLTKKIAVGDTLSVNLVGRAFGNPERFSSLELVVAVYAYAIEIYCDFSGYTDVAIGSALLFGYELPENFRAPYLARNLQDFWHRWHISLSTWLRDYLYVPLGGSRRGARRTYVNLMITMLLGGLWHGASWNFVIWGGLHGAGLAVTRVWQRRRSEGRLQREPSLGVELGTTFLTFQFVCLAWVFFRAPSFGHATLLLGRIARVGATSWGLANVSPRVALVLAAGFVMHAIPADWEARVRERFVRLPAPAMGVLLALAAYGLHLAAGAKTEPFVYGQF
jgi:D-alanyl-lipoteichoic acid acyltransferase DltB (MBOAT superfamily)